MKFRNDIEGLRGVAVLLVVLAHAGVPWLAGGFIGVDVFFVISGFLITGLLVDELGAAGRIDLWHFYARRVRRLLPAFTVMALLVAIALAWWVPATAVDFQARSGLWSSLWSSNNYFAFAEFDYFGDSATGSVFLHTWSLGVEEQFYLVWPLFIGWAWRSRAQSGWVVAAVVVGFIACQAIQWANPMAAYYLMPARLWQLALGGLAFHAIRHPRGLPTPVLRVMPWAGVLLLAISAIAIDGTTAYPGVWALLPSLASFALLVAATHPNVVSRRLLASPLLALPGRVSYSWYLWHWPFLTLPAAAGIAVEGWLLPTALVLGSFLVACASHALVEQPCRRSRAPSDKVTVLSGLLAAVVLAGVFLYMGRHGVGATGEAGTPAELEQQVRSQITVPRIYRQPGCDQWYHSAQLVPCGVDDPSLGQDAGAMILVADSVGAQWLPAIEASAHALGKQLIVLTKSSCPLVDEPFFYERIKRRFTECEQWRLSVVEYVGEIRPDIVVVGSSVAYPFDAAQWRGGSQRMLAGLRGSGAAVLLLAPSPRLPFNGPKCIFSKGRLIDGGLEAPGCRVALENAVDAEVLDSLADAVRATPGTALVRLDDLVCPDGTCAAVREGRVVYRDGQHLNAAYVEDVAPAFVERMQAGLDAASGSGSGSTPDSPNAPVRRR